MLQSIAILFEQEYARNALIAGVAVGSVCSLLSVVVVLKRMAFIVQGISHAGFGGAGLAVLLAMLGWKQDLLLMVFCIATALLIGFLSRRRQLEPDSAIGILLVAGMGMGVLLTNLRVALLTPGHLWHWPWYARHFSLDQVPPGPETLLFGSPLTVDRVQIVLAVSLSVLVLLIAAAFFKEILFYTFDEPVSRVFGVPAGLMHYLVMMLLAITIVLCMRLVGFLLVSALTVVPGATAMLLSRRLALVLVLAWITGVVGVVGGLVLALELQVFSPGACIVLVLCLLFGLAYLSRVMLSATKA